ncbi:MAG TPA: hypothetical protein ENN13_00115 [Candidatus Altiarchaeales archaeon]|nr:hypothetical protein [Candidatus Altiarchaeales archaeon]
MLNPLKILVGLLTKLGFNKRQAITYEQVKDILSFYTSEYRVQDKTYRTYTKGEIEAYSLINLEKLKAYIDDLYDCDDYSMSFMNSAKSKMPYAPLGVAHIYNPNAGGENKKHALNFFIDEKKKVWMIEPQDGKIFKKPDEWKTTFMII